MKTRRTKTTTSTSSAASRRSTSRATTGPRPTAWRPTTRAPERRLQAERAAADELAASLLLLADPLIVFDDQLAAREHGRRAARDLAAFERRVVDAHVQRVLAENLLALRIPHDDVGVSANTDRALLAVHAEDLRRRRRRDLDEAIHRDLALRDAFPEQMQTRLDARHAVRDLREVVSAQLLLVFHAEGAVVCRDDREVVVAQAAPEVILVVLEAERRGGDVASAFELVARFAAQVILVEEEVLRAGFGVGREAAIAGFHDALQRALRREVHHVDRDLRHLGQRDRALGAGGFGDFGPRQRVIDGRGVALGKRALDQDVDRKADFGVHRDERTEL